MKTNLTELVFILDRSGSMGGLESDTIGGFNSMLKKQQAESGECRITTVLFDDKYEVLHDRIDIKAVSPLNEQEYFVRGSTALLDAIGKTINKIGIPPMWSYLTTSRRQVLQDVPRTMKQCSRCQLKNHPPASLR